jgi:pimeloyl-ACP methyl ester carboxylesterase
MRLLPAGYKITDAVLRAAASIALALALALDPCVVTSSPTARAAATPAAAESWMTLPAVPALPTPSASGYAPVNGIRMFYAVFGEGPPVLLLHGGLANADYWGYVIPILVQHRLKVVVADSRGHGRSTRTAQPYSYDLMTSDVLGLLDFLRLPKVDIVGWSDGAIIGLDLAMNDAPRLRRLYAYGANADPSGVKDVEKNATFTRYIEQARRDYQRLSPTPQDYDRFLAQIQLMWAEQPNFTPVQLQRIAAPTAIADGAHEEAIKREHTEYLARTIPGAKLVILPDVSHFGILQNPQEFADSVLAFLTAP